MNSTFTRKTMLHRSKGWPNPKDSVGTFYRKMGSLSCWEAVDKARQAFLCISPEIRTYLLRNSDPPRHNVTWSIYMIGRTEEKAQPVILFCSENIDSRRQVRKAVEESRILDDYPGIKLGDTERPPDVGRVDELAFEYPKAEDPVSPAFSLDKRFYTPLNPSGDEIRLLRIDPGDETSRIVCEFVKVSLTDPGTPTYYATRISARALSLPAYSVYICLNGIVCEIPLEIGEILRRHRAKTSTRYVWLDALCLDPNGIEDSAGAVRGSLGKSSEDAWDALRSDHISWKAVFYEPFPARASKQVFIPNYSHYPHTIRKATVGAIFRSGEIYLYMTVAHAFNDKREPPSSELQENIETFDLDLSDDNDSSDSDDEPQLLAEITSRGSLTPEPTEYANSETVSSSADTCLDQTARSHESSAASEVGVTKDVNSDVKGSSPLATPVPEESNTSPRPLAVAGNGLATSFDGTLGLDYALIEIQEPGLQTFNEVTFNTESKTILLFPQRVVPALPPNTSVFAVTGSSGVLKGTLSGTPTFKEVPNSFTIQELWTVRLDGKLAQGDCGSLVVDADNGDAIGHIVSGNTETGVAYIIPLYQALEEAQSQLHIKLSLATRANSPKARWTEARIPSQDGGTQLESKGKGVAGPETAEGNVIRLTILPPERPVGHFNSLNSWVSNIDNMSTTSTYVDSSSSQFYGLSSRANVSRITVVEDDPELAYTDFKSKIVELPKYTLFDHLKDLVLKPTRQRSSTTQKEKLPAKISLESDSEENLRFSPWILSVYVLSARQDENKHYMPKEAKCTIDTGNHQGNMVSLNFVVDVLGIDPSTFKPLTKFEQQGGTGVTGHRLIPDGAVYLTWYHSNSTRVFRDMRFLVIPNAAYDLILGARSIKEHSILDVPNLDAPPIPRLAPQRPRNWKLAASQINPPSTIAEHDELTVKRSKPDPAHEHPKPPLPPTAKQMNLSKQPLDRKGVLEEPLKATVSLPKTKMPFSRPSISQMLNRKKYKPTSGLLSAEEVS